MDKLKIAKLAGAAAFGALVIFLPEWAELFTEACKATIKPAE